MSSRAWARQAERSRRATMLVREAMSGEDVERIGLCAEHILADDATALMLFGGPDPSTVAREAVVQRYGRVGALIVVAYEERWSVDRTADESALDRLVREFDRLDARSLYELLVEIEQDDRAASVDLTVDAHRWLHATYAVAARDGTAAAHRAYMRALDDVMRLVRPLVAS